MGTIRIARLTGTSDTVSTSTDKIDFNTDVKTKIENAFITGFEENPTDGVGNNQGAEQDLGDQQALGAVEDIIKIDGFFSKRDGDLNDGQNSFLILLDTWIAEPKINDNWQLGRFGITDADDQTHDLLPVRTGTDQIALLWEKIQRRTDFKGRREHFTLWFRINRGDGT